MSELLSVGLDVGTTTTQLVVSKLTAKNLASSFAVPRMEITDREILYQSQIHFTPLIRDELIDGEGIRRIVEAEYQKAGIKAEAVDTGAVIITGETSRKENAESVLHALSRLAGNFVVATAGPDLESVLAAKGAGAVDASEKGPVLHFDIGGGTSNLALCIDGKVAATGCLNVGGRLLKFDNSGNITYISPVLRQRLSLWESCHGKAVTERATDSSLSLGMTVLHGVGADDHIGPPSLWATARYLATILEMAAGLRDKTEDYYHFLTPGTTDLIPPKGVTISFSGGVADCIETETDPLAYGDLGPLLGRAIKESRLCRGSYRLGSHTIRATVIGAGCHSAQLSGSTIFRQNTPLPIRNLPAAVLTSEEQDSADFREIIQRKLSALDAPGALFLPGWKSPSYHRVTALADILKDFRCPIVLEADMAKALGNALALRLPPQTPILCIDGLSIPEGSFLDIGAPAGPSLTVIVKTLIFER